MPILPSGDPWLPADLGGATTVVAVSPEVWRKSVGFDRAERLASVECLAIQEHEGPRPAVAHFRYRFGDGNPASPQRIEQALDVGFALPEVVTQGDTLYVVATRPDSRRECLFHGEPVGFEGGLSPDGEEATLLAVGVSRRLSDTPIGGAFLRSSAFPLAVADEFHVETSLPAVFNPKGLPNCTAESSDWYYAGDSTDLDRQYPAFLDVHAPAQVDDPNNAGEKLDARTKWTLAKAARYLIWRHNADQEFVTNPLGRDLDELLVAIEPVDEFTTIDLDNPHTFQAKPIEVANTPITGRDWLPVLHALAADKGFAMALRPELQGSSGDVGNVTTRLDLYRVQTGPVKDLFLQPPGSDLDLTLSNVAGLDVTRDVSDAPNRVVVTGGQVLWQADFVLARGYPIDPDDAATGTGGLDRFKQDTIDEDTTRADADKYRTYVLDEDGTGHYATDDAGADQHVTGTPTSLDSLFGTPDPDTNAPAYATRARPAKGSLVSADDNGRPLKVVLSYSTDYSGPSPAVWDASATGTDAGTWIPIQGGFTLLKDRLGIRISVEDPNHWTVGDKKVIRGVEAQAAPVPPPTGQNPRFYLKLTAVIESDEALEGVADRRSGAALAQTITRTVDARDRYFKAVIAPNSSFNPVPTGPGAVATEIVVRDDTEAARAEATALRDATDAGVLDGSVTIPRVTTYYQIGDRIREIDGRNLGFRTDGGGTSASPIYPTVVGRSFDFMGQRTTLQISDAMTHRKSYRRANPRRRTSHG